MRISKTLMIFAVLSVAGAGAFADEACQAVPAPKHSAADTTKQTQAVLAQHFDKNFDVHATDHFVVLHQTDAYIAAGRAALLETTHRQFEDTFLQAGFTLRPLDQPMVCVLFANEQDFGKYAKRVDWIDMSWSGGYYSSRTNRVALFDTGGWPGSGTVAEAEGNRDAYYGATDAATSATTLISLASTTHEAAHQLAFNTGLQRRGVMYPLWASEGLATNFESDVFFGDLGPHAPNATRQRDLMAAYRNDLLLPLDQFACLTEVPTADPRMVSVVYAQAWELFRYLFIHERQGLIRYMDQLNHTPQGYRSKRQMYEEFVAAFGPIDALETRWRESLRKRSGR